MKTLALVLSLTVLLLAGCKSGWISGKQMNRLSLGMSKAEVKKILGEPHSSEARDGVDLMWYLEDQGQWKHVPYYVGFKDGKLSTFGPGKASGAALR